MNARIFLSALAIGLFSLTGASSAHGYDLLDVMLGSGSGCGCTAPKSGCCESPVQKNGGCKSGCGAHQKCGAAQKNCGYKSDCGAAQKGCGCRSGCGAYQKCGAAQKSFGCKSGCGAAQKGCGCKSSCGAHQKCGAAQKGYGCKSGCGPAQKGYDGSQKVVGVYPIENRDLHPIGAVPELAEDAEPNVDPRREISFIHSVR